MAFIYMFFPFFYTYKAKNTPKKALYNEKKLI